MAKYRVNPDETNTSGFLLFADDRLLVAAGGSIARADGPAAQILGADVAATILNYGTMAVSTTASPVITGSFSGDLALRIFNKQGAVIDGQSGAISLASATDSTGSVRIQNEGTIDGHASSALAMRDLAATDIIVTNLAGAVITNAGTADVVRPGNDLYADITVNNYGTIRAGTVQGATSGGDGVDLQSKDGGHLATINNYGDGVIEGGKHGVTGANAADIYNEGTITGRNGSGLNFDTDAGDSDGAVKVNNFGTITGAYDGYGNGDGDGVDVDYLVNVRNYGTIQGVGADNIDDFADGVAAGGGKIANKFGATIYGETNGILIDDGDRNGAYAETRIINDGYITGKLGYGVRLIGDFNDAVTNHGTIAATDHAAAAIDLGGGDDRLVNTGDIDGDILLGDGNDFVRSGNVLGVIDGGAGDDHIQAGRNDDTIYGGLGIDEMWGAKGADTYVYKDIAEADLSDPNHLDTIHWGKGDILDLSGIDADTTQDGDQAFSTLYFHRIDPGVLTVAGDVNNDGVVDFMIKVVGVDDPAALTITL